MAGNTQRVMHLSLWLGLLVVLWASFSSSEHSLTLALGGLFATAIGVAMMMRPTQQHSTTGTHLIPNVRATGTENVEGTSEQLPDPLELNLDMPL